MPAKGETGTLRCWREMIWRNRGPCRIRESYGPRNLLSRLWRVSRFACHQDQGRFLGAVAFRLGHEPAPFFARPRSPPQLAESRDKPGCRRAELPGHVGGPHRDWVGGRP